MKKIFKLSLQFFGGEGAGAAGSAGASGTGAGEGNGDGATTTGVNNAAADAEQRLRELGVPESKIRKRASKAPSAAPAQTVRTVAAEPNGEAKADTAAAKDNPTEDNASSINWEEITKNPEFNKRIQAIVSSRVKDEKSAKEALNKMAPAFEVLARKYDLDSKNMDYEVLAQKINDDDAYYEDKALEMGSSVEFAKKVDQKERAEARQKDMEERQKAMEQRTLQEQAYEQHFISLERQGEELRKIFPNFDLRKELKNPAFARMTAPGTGIMSVEDAYRAVHRKEIEAASSQIIAQKTAEKLSNAIRSGSRRPQESGASSQAPSVTSFNYKNASREQREAFKKDLRTRLARGEKVYPGT
jgi:hypothetical protein